MRPKIEDETTLLTSSIDRDNNLKREAKVLVSSIHITTTANSAEGRGSSPNLFEFCNVTSKFRSFGVNIIVIFFSITKRDQIATHTSPENIREVIPICCFSIAPPYVMRVSEELSPVTI